MKSINHGIYPTQQELKEIISYDDSTGMFRWLVDRPNRIRAGDVAGSVGTRGYIQIFINHRCLKAHRLAWIYVYGEQAPQYIDHINGITSDNRISNLRLASSSENQQNRTNGSSRSSTGFLGVSLHRGSGKYQAQIKYGGKNRLLGLFDTPEVASRAYVDAKRQHHEFCTI